MLNLFFQSPSIYAIMSLDIRIMQAEIRMLDVKVKFQKKKNTHFTLGAVRFFFISSYVIVFINLFPIFRGKTGVLILFHQTFGNKALGYSEYFEKTHWSRDSAHDLGTGCRMFESRRVKKFSSANTGIKPRKQQLNVIDLS